MRTYTQEELKIKVVRGTANDFLYSIEKSFNKDYEWWDNRYTYWRLNSVGIGCRTFVAKPDDRNLRITLDVNDIEQYANINEVSLQTATKLLLSHEIFHILLGHFSSKYKNHNKRLLNIAGDIEINQLIGLKAPGLQVADFGYKPFRNTDYYYDKLKADLDAKMQEQQNVDLNMPTFDNVDSEEGELPEDAEQLGNSFGESDTMTPSDEMEDGGNNGSTSKLEDMINEQAEKSNESGFNNNCFNNDMMDMPDTNEAPENNASTGADGDGRGQQTLEDSLIDDMIPGNRVVNEKTSDMMKQQEIDIDVTLKKVAEIENTIKKDLSKEDTYTIKGLKEIIRKIENKEKEVKITPHDRVNTYHKFNNRRKNGNFILPGKKLTNEGLKKKLDTSLTVFIDVSGSTRGRINKDLMNVAKKMHRLGATIVYYTDYIISICEPDSIFFTEDAGGCTEITRVIPEYLQNHELERAYVFTDGRDDFGPMKEVCKKFTVYFIEEWSHSVYEKYTEKSARLSRWG